jgi:hypothetical protein
MTEPDLQPLSQWKVTALGVQLNANGRINATQFEGTAMDLTTWALISVYAVNNNEPTCVVLLDQLARNIHERVTMPIDTFNAYETNGWIRRVDIASPQNIFPVKSMWRTTALGFANLGARSAFRLPDTIWMVQSVHLCAQYGMSQCMRFLNLSEHRRNPQARQNQPRYPMHRIVTYLRNGWIERIDPPSD